MQYQDHKDYPLYAHIISELLNADLQITDKPLKHTLTTQPQTIAEQPITEKKHHETTSWIGKKIQKLTILGILKLDSGLRHQKRFVCKCECGNFHTIPIKVAKSKNYRYMCCEVCANKINAFEVAFSKKTNKFLSNEVVISIFGNYDGAEFENFISHTVTNENVTHIQNLPIRIATKEKLISLLKPNSDIEQIYFRKTHNKDGFINSKSQKIIPNTFINRPKTNINQTTLPNDLKQLIGKKLFKLKINRIELIDIKINSELKNNLIYICECDCGHYCKIKHKHIENMTTPTCGRCDVIANELIRRELHDNGRQITPLDAWSLLNIDTAKIEDEKREISYNRRNSSTHEGKSKEPNYSYAKHQKITGIKYGFFTITNNPSDNDVKDIEHQVVGICDCGNKTHHPLKLFSNPRLPPYLACQTCTIEINSVVSPLKKRALGKTRNDSKRAWCEYLAYKNHNQAIKMSKVMQRYFELKLSDNTLNLSDCILRILDEQSPKAKVA